MTTADVPPLTVALPDGRTLAYHEYGDPAGRPVLFVPGSPASGVTGTMWDGSARAAGVRWIALDKPGFGGSSVDRSVSLASVARDIRDLLDALGLGSVPVVAESGGAPFGLAMAHDHPDRVSALRLVAGMGPASQAWARVGMKPANKQAFWLAKHAPWMLRPTMKRIARMDRDTLIAWAAKGAAPADAKIFAAHPEVLDVLSRSTHDALRGGPDMAVREMALFARPWHFAIEDVTVPVELWHGTEDTNVPVAIAREVAHRLPHCEAHFIDGKGHLLSVEHQDDVLGSITGSAS